MVKTVAAGFNMPTWWVVSYLIAQAGLWGFTSYGWHVLWVASCLMSYLNHGLVPVFWHVFAIPAIKLVKL